MTWAVWLAVPVTVTAVAALWVWWRGRPQRAPTVREAVQAHRDYLDALAIAARGPRQIPSAGRTEAAGVRD